MIKSLNAVALSTLILSVAVSATAQTTTQTQTQNKTPAPAAKTTEQTPAPAAKTEEKSASGAEDITDVTVFLKKKSSVPQQNMRIDTRSASSCGFFGSDGSADYMADYIRDFTGSNDASDPNSFDENSPNGDASRDGGTSFFDQNQAAADSESGEPSTGGCTTTDRAFAAARARIARNDTTITEAFALFDQKKYPEALAMFKKSYDKIGYEDAALMIGKMYLYGMGTQKDSKQAVYWFRRVAERPFDINKEIHKFDPKNPEAANTLAEANLTLAKIYLTGYGVPKDQKEALKWFERASYIGYIPATKTVGDMYYNGVGTTKDVKKAVKNYQDAAKYGYAPAQYALAEILYTGEGDIKADRKMALAWYNESAKANHPGGLYALGVAYDAGEGVPADQQKALGFYKEAAIRGNADAQNAVGTYFYQGGSLLPKDDTAARQWFEVAAKNGQTDAQFNLAVMYMKGEGGPKNLVNAYLWFAMARKGGHENATAALKAVQAQMTEADKAELSKLLAPEPKG
ncbi:SEL1-like repeat protein [Asticcacaulis sp. BYS171W]|uniref:SEL1-like repeat protein n=1 Tax=Asticcacaulis aquaticus TaxID=2984212 RepID=A0ABT5HTC2_9CAUL|nr:SEL1-like repeat protein [Asticcacaulis aquaticus]MDC7683308.1 SEL1-like repeat protein [Asticcacaulis aquaticus]